MIDGLGPEASKLMREAHRDAPTYPQRTRMWEAIEAGAIAGASIEVERRQGCVEAAKRFASLDRAGLIGRDGLRVLSRAPVGVDRMPALVAPMLARHAKHDLKQPRARPVTALFELGDVPVRDDEDLLGLVGSLALGDAHAPKVAPYEVDVCLVQNAKRSLFCGVHRAPHDSDSSPRSDSGAIKSPDSPRTKL